MEIVYTEQCYCHTSHSVLNLTGEHQSSIPDPRATVLPNQGGGEGTHCSWELQDTTVPWDGAKHCSRIGQLCPRTNSQQAVTTSHLSHNDQW